jgi:hypothetical protein
MGRPPAPIEHHRRVGRANGRKKADGRPLPEVGKVVALPPTNGVPPYPADLGLEGRSLWDMAWNAALTWIAPGTDAKQIEEAARTADDLAAARARYRATTDPADARALVALSKQFTEALSALGFNPTARARLGVAEVRRVSQLEELQAKREKRR